jgi:hypothetical protein
MSGNVVISEVDALMLVVLSMAEKHVQYGKLVSTTGRITLYTRCRIYRSRCNRIQLYLAVNTSPLIPMDNMLL